MIHDPARQAVVAATQLVRPLFDCLGLCEDVVHLLQTDVSPREDVRAVAIRIARVHGDDPGQLNRLSWPVVMLPDEEGQAYERAARLAEAACRMEPEDGDYLNTFGVAQYRLGEYEKALATLTRSDEVNGGKEPADVAFLAMANQRLGRIEAARAALARLRELMKDPDVSKTREDAQNFLSEAEALIGD